MSIKEEFDRIVPDLYKDIFNNRDSGYTLLNRLITDYEPSQIITSKENQKRQRIWEIIGLFYMENRGFFESLQIFFGLYQHMLRWQLENNIWTHKAMPLVRMSDIADDKQYEYISCN